MILPNPSDPSSAGGRRPSRRDTFLPDTRQKMIDETSAFLTWAVAEDRGLPRIPRRAVGGGGFGTLVMSRPMARALSRHFWRRAFDLVGRKR